MGTENLTADLEIFVRKNQIKTRQFLSVFSHISHKHDSRYFNCVATREDHRYPCFEQTETVHSINTIQ